MVLYAYTIHPLLFPDLATLRARAPAVPSDLPDAYRTANWDAPRPVVAPRYRLQVRLLDSTEEASLFPRSASAPDSIGNFWRNFRRQFPASAGIAAFSDIGFDRTDSWALLYFRRSCGGLCAEGYTVLLRREAGAWRILSAHMDMVA